MARLTRRFTLSFLLASLTASQAMAAEEEGAKKPKASFINLGDFTVNLPDGSASGYIVIGITLEVMPEALADMKDLSPRLKDIVVRRLMTMAQSGMLQPGHTDPLMLKTSLSDSLASVRPDSLKEVLITHLLYG